MVQPATRETPLPTVLVVDGSPEERRTLTRAVEALGFEAMQAFDAEDAMTVLAGRSVSVVLADWPASDAPAISLLERVRARERLEQTPYTAVVLLIPPSVRAAVPAALAAGADGFVSRPIDDADLAAALAVAARLARLERRVVALGDQLAHQQELLREEIRRDQVTRLGNRLRLDEDLRRVRGRAQRYGHRATAVMLAVDHLRRYNEVMGIAAGDEVLRRVAGAIRSCLRDADTAYRYTGDQVLVLLPEQAEDGGVVVAERCRSAVAALRIPHPRSDAADTITISAGVAELPGGSRDAVDAWLRRADLALDAAKAAGRNTVVRSGHTRIAGVDEAPRS
ncbi:MAG: diguanylate cyclase [Chloroflexota bacterium]